VAGTATSLQTGFGVAWEHGSADGQATIIGGRNQYFREKLRIQLPDPTNDIV
jgi:hypothetical protein